MTTIPAEFEPFWRTAESLTPGLDRSRFLEAFAFGDSEALACELAALVLAGTKRATASLAAMYAVEGRQQPRPGDLSLVLSWAREPLCVIETSSIEVRPFEEVSAEFAREEGEGDGTLASWRHNHELFFGRECRRLGIEPSPRMAVVCERFRVVFQLEGTAHSARAAATDGLS